MYHPTDRITHTTVFVTPVVEHWLEREIAQWVHSMKDRSDDPSHHERTLLPYLAPHTTDFNKRTYIGSTTRLKEEMFYIKVHSAREKIYCCYFIAYSFKFDNKESFKSTTPISRTTHTTAVVHWLEREIAQWVHHEGSTRPQIG